MKQIIMSVAIALSTLTINATILDFDIQSPNHTWTEDGLEWGYFGVNADIISNANPYKGIGHAEALPGNDSRLGTSVNFDLQGMYLYSEFAESSTHLVIKGYDEEGQEIISKALEASDYNKQYLFVSLGWKNIASFEVEFDSSNELEPAVVHYDNVMYTPVRDVDAVALTEPTSEEYGYNHDDRPVPGTELDKVGNLEMVLFPNPAFGDVTKVALRNMEKGDKTIIFKIIDSYGSLVSEQKIETNAVDIKHSLTRLESLVPGPHVVQVSIGVRTISETLMVR